ncbi:MAG: MMPL family transporter, partial [Bifidobacteriaceae bacterium]|nr:MMPL family transporter [Bifidobacteriaceae bacterium]
MGRIAAWSARHALPVIVVWLVFAAAVAAVGTMAGSPAGVSADIVHGEAGQAHRAAQAAGAPEPVVESVIVTSADGAPLDTRAAEAALADVATRLMVSPQVGLVAPEPVLADDGAAAMLRLRLAGDLQTAADDVSQVLAAADRLAADHPEWRVEQTGPASAMREADHRLAAVLLPTAAVSAALVLVIALMALGAGVLAGLPLAMGVAATGAGLVAWAPGSSSFPDRGVVPLVIVLTGMAAGAGFALTYLVGVRDEVRACGNRAAATTRAADSAGVAVVVSAAAGLAGLAATFLLADPAISAVASG